MYVLHILSFHTDVVGIIKDYDNIRDLRNKHGKDQRQAKFIITDGRYVQLSETSML